ncbi:MAG: hypothetical protein EAZ85_05580 [Bacteroidetes bacterium]|nr:MAG: hypothetical protein EAZ85_05580 [Bacteroidota bacterium]TAG89282.1 MAG: hypothetical protein EAZ20_06850 [Bacteroidota bacterium]
MNQNNIENELNNIQKNINDLISQEITLWIWAEMVVSNPESEKYIEKIWQKTYQNISANIQDILINLKKNNIDFWKDMEESKIKASVQNFIWELIEEKKELLEKYIDTIRRNKT